VQPAHITGSPCIVGTPLGQLYEEQPATAIIVIVIVIANAIADCARGLVFVGVAGARADFGMGSFLYRVWFR